MLMRCVFTLTAGLLASTLAIAADEKPAGKAPLPTFVVQMKPLDELLADVKHITKLASPDNVAAAMMIDGGVAMGLGADWKKALDANKPFGMYGILKGELAESNGVLLLPVVNNKEFLKLFERIGTKPDFDEKDGTYSFNPPGVPLPVYFKFANSYCYATMGLNSDAIRGALPKPEDVLKGDPKGLLDLKFFIDRLPETLRKFIMEQIESNLENLPQAGAGDAAADIKKAVDQLQSFMQEGKEFGFKIDFDRSSNDMGLEVFVSAKAGTKFAKEIYTSVKPGKGKMAGLVTKDTIASLVANISGDAESKDVDDEQVFKMLKEALKNMEFEVKDEALRTLTKALFASMPNGDLDMTAVLRGPVGGKYGLVAGLGIKKGADLEKAVKTFVASLGKADKARFKIDARKINGVNIHEFNLGEDLPAEARKLFGDLPVLIAFKEQAMYVSFGGTEQILADAMSAPAKAGPQMVMELQPVGFAKMLEASGSEKPNLKAIEKAFGKDKMIQVFYMKLKGGEGVTVRYGTDLGAVMKFIQLMADPKD